MKKINQQGQTLIETIAALAIISIIITGIATAITTSLNNAKYDQDQTLATKYAQQGSEIVQQIRDDSYTNFQTFNTSNNTYYCLGKGQTSLGSVKPSCASNVDNFVRTVQIQQNGCGANIAQVTIAVSFTDGKCANGVYCHKQTMSTCLSTANPVQVP